MAKAHVKISFDEKGGVGVDIELGVTIDKKSGKVVLTRPSAYLMVEEACIYARAWAMEERRRRVAAKKAKKATKVVRQP